MDGLGRKHMSHEAVEELRLARRASAGEPAALEAFYQRFAEPLFAFIFHRMDAPRPDVEEVWQDTLLAALNGLPGFQGDSALFTWMCAIACHKMVDHYRRRGATHVAAATLPLEQVDRLLDREPLPEEWLVRGEVRSQVVAALEMLPPEYRCLLKERYLEGAPVAELAMRWGKSYKAIESSLARARQAFRQAFIGLKEAGEDGKE